MLNRKQGLLIVGTMTFLPPLLVKAFPSLEKAGPILVFAGFAGLILVWVVGAFRRHKIGPFQFYKEPVGYLRTEFSPSEKWLFAIAGSIFFGGLLSIAVTVSR